MAVYGLLGSVVGQGNKRRFGSKRVPLRFLVGYDTMKKMEGIVPLVLKQPVVIDTALPVSVLARIGIENGRLVLKGKSVYQPVRAQ